MIARLGAGEIVRFDERPGAFLESAQHARGRPTRPADLARHLGVGAPTLSALLRRLETLGYVARRRSESDGRSVELRLTAQGAAAMQDTSVLETSRVRALLATLTAGERVKAVAGLVLLARGARALATRRRQTPPD